MRKTMMAAIALLAALLLVCFPLRTEARAEELDGLFLYSDIPFESATPKDVQRILLEKGIAESADERDDYPVEDFGYSWYLRIDYNQERTGVDRVALARAGSGYATGEAFAALYKKDILCFLDVERQLAERYGEPDARYFQSDSYRYGQKSMTKYMFSTGLWDSDSLENVADNDGNLIAFSEWKNVCLRLWVNGKDERANGYLTKLDLYYQCSALHTKPLTIVEYPREIE